jgi:CheY-like chemotaxis protein
MTPEVMGRIFDPFFTTKATGRGLGLSAMLGILQGHGGGLHLTSLRGRGTTFRLCFPALSGISTPAPAPPETASNRALRGRVLVVDDEPQLLDVVASALVALGFEVERAMDGVEALERFKEQHASLSLVLMDLTMPRMDGWEAFLAMRAIAPGVPVVLCSGYSEQEAMRPGTEQAPAAFLQKPFQLRMLRSTLERVLGG